MSQPPHEPPAEPPNEPPAEPPANPPPPLPGQWMPPEHLPPPPGMPPAYGAPIPPPTPKKSHLGLIIGLVVAGFAVLVGLLVIGLVVYSDDDFDDDASDEETTSSTEAEEAEETEPTEEPEPEGEVLQGDGYTYELPDGWQDISAAVETQDAAGTIDSASAPGDSLATTFANVIVESGPANGRTDLETIRDEVAQNFGAAVGGTAEEVEGPTVDDVDTLGLQLTQTNPAGIDVLQDAYITIVDDTYYVIGFSRDSTKDEFDDDFDAIIGSWSWE